MRTRKQLTGVIAMVAAVLMIVGLCACGSKDVNITIDDNGTTTQVTAAAGKTVSEVLSAADIKVNEGDEVNPALDSKITESTNKIVIKRQVKVSIVADEQTIEVELVGGSVKDALEKAGITLAEGDTVDVQSDTLLKDGMVITVTRVQVTPPADVDEPASSQSSSKGESASSASDDDEGDAGNSAPARTVVSKTKVPNCADGSHGYYEILYSDGSTEYVEY